MACTIEHREDGVYHVSLLTGEIFKGTADEVITSLSEAHVNTKRWAQDKERQYEGLARLIMAVGGKAKE